MHYAFPYYAVNVTKKKNTSCSHYYSYFKFKSSRLNPGFKLNSVWQRKITRSSNQVTWVHTFMCCMHGIDRWSIPSRSFWLQLQTKLKSQKQKNLIWVSEGIDIASIECLPENSGKSNSDKHFLILTRYLDSNTGLDSMTQPRWDSALWWPRLFPLSQSLMFSRWLLSFQSSELSLR